MLTTFRFFGLLAGFLVVSLQCRAQISARQPTYNLLSVGSNSVTDYALNDQNIFSKADIHSLKTSEIIFNDLSELSHNLCPEYFSEREKVRSIYFWIAKNITYDDKGLEENTLPSQDAEAIFQHKRGVCEGFSNLFIQLCAYSGIESRVIAGYAIDDYFDRDQIITYPNHAWNAVKIDGQWQLLDVTWACLSRNQPVVSNTNIEYFKYKLESNFLIEPTEFLKTHLPEDPYWQLIPGPINYEEFISGEFGSISEDLSIDVNKRISDFESLDSLDQEIAFCQRMVENDWNKIKEYRLGMAYYYKAQQLYRKLGKLQGRPRERVVESIDKYYERSLTELNKLTPSDFGYNYSVELISTIIDRKELFSLNK